MNNPVEPFDEMFKYYSNSPVVHPAVSCAFLLNVVQNNTRGIELDPEQNYDDTFFACYECWEPTKIIQELDLETDEQSEIIQQEINKTEKKW